MDRRGSGGGVGLVYLGVPVVAAILIARKDGDRYVTEDGARVTGWLAFIVGILAYLALLTDELPGGARVSRSTFRSSDLGRRRSARLFGAW